MKVQIKDEFGHFATSYRDGGSLTVNCYGEDGGSVPPDSVLQVCEWDHDGCKKIRVWNISTEGINFRIANQAADENENIFPGNLPAMDRERTFEIYLHSALFACMWGVHFRITCLKRGSEVSSIYHRRHWRGSSIYWGIPVFCDPVKGKLCDQIFVLSRQGEPRSVCKDYVQRDKDWIGPSLIHLTGTHRRKFFFCTPGIGGKFQLDTECDALLSHIESKVETISDSNRYIDRYASVHCNGREFINSGFQNENIVRISLVFFQNSRTFRPHPDVGPLVLRQGIGVGMKPFKLKPRNRNTSSDTSVKCFLIPLGGRERKLTGNLTDGWTVKVEDLGGNRTKLLCNAEKKEENVARWQFYLYPAGRSNISRFACYFLGDLGRPKMSLPEFSE